MNLPTSEDLYFLPYHNYKVWNDGRIQGPSGRILKPWITNGRNGNEYHKVKLCTGHGRRTFYEIWFVHRLVAYVHYGPFTELAWLSAIVDHLDMNTLNNHVLNLQVVDCRENLRRAREERESVPF